MREETRCRHMGYSFLITSRVLLYAPSHRKDSTYHSLCYTSRGALAGTRNSSMGPPHEGSIRRPISPWANALTTELHLAPVVYWCSCQIPHTQMSLHKQASFLSLVYLAVTWALISLHVNRYSRFSPHSLEWQSDRMVFTTELKTDKKPNMYNR